MSDSTNMDAYNRLSLEKKNEVKILSLVIAEMQKNYILAVCSGSMINSKVEALIKQDFYTDDLGAKKKIQQWKEHFEGLVKSEKNKLSSVVPDMRAVNGIDSSDFQIDKLPGGQCDNYRWLNIGR